VLVARVAHRKDAPSWTHADGSPNTFEGVHGRQSKSALKWARECSTCSGWAWYTGLQLLWPAIISGVVYPGLHNILHSQSWALELGDI